MGRKPLIALLVLLIGTELAGQDRSSEIDQLLNPKALPARTASETAAQLRSNFSNPPAEYRSMPLWVWNDELEWPRLREQLQQFQRQGMGGVFVHPRPGLMTKYLGPDWFRLWKLSVEESRRLGTLTNIYDENSYPSGFAGGLVPARAPDTAAEYVQADLDVPANRVPWRAAETVAVFAGKEGPRLQRSEQLPAGQSAIVFRLRRASGNPWTGGFPYVDLTNPETARHFIETTFERYKAELGQEFGGNIRWVFDDEPLIATGGAYDAATLALPLSRNTLSEFRKRCGYDLAGHMPSLYWDVGEFRKVRFDYWQTLHDLWKENYLRPIFQWCDRNNLQFTGHWMEHEWPYPWITPADASLYAYQHVPGIDMLEGSNIRTQGKDPHMLFTIKQVASVAHQLGRRAFCEAYGVAGWDSTFEHYKRFGDWLMVHGVNFMNQHLAFATVRGARKRDHPQSFTDVSAWWPYYKLHGDHLGRVSYMLSRGAARNRLLLLEPTTSGFLWARRGDATPELARMRAGNGELIQFLVDHQVDFDLADEYILEWFGKQNGRKLAVGRASYDLLVWPDNMTNVRHETLPRLEDYLAAGGEILALGPPAAFVDGRPSDKVAALRKQYASQWHSVSGLPNLLAAVQKRLSPRFIFEPPLPSGVGVSERFLGNGDRVIFFANTALVSASSKVTLDGGALEGWDTTTGSTSLAAFESAGAGRLHFDLDLKPAGSAMFLVTKASAASQPEPAIRSAPVEAGDWRIAADAKNVLVLDYCDLTAPAIEMRDVNTWEANWTLWQAHGFVRPAWDNAVQFKTRVFDRNKFPPSSGFDATFRFEVGDAAALGGLELAVEVPELYKIALNDKPVSFAQSTRWLDPRIRSVVIEKLAQPGENVLRITGRPFDVRMELENVYLRGNFSVSATGKGFSLAAPEKLDFGSWAAQGYPFYGEAVTYRAEVDVPQLARRLRVELGKWAGSVAAVLLDGKQVATLGWQPYEAQFAATPGKHRVEVRVVSTPRNIFGPFHNRTKPRMRAWPAAWADFPERQPPGSVYDVIEYGLMEPFRLSVSETP